MENKNQEPAKKQGLLKLARALAYISLVATGLVGITLTGPALMTALAAKGILGIGAATLIPPLTSGAAIFGGAGMLLGDIIPDIFKWGKNKVLGIRDSFRALRQYVRDYKEKKRTERENENSKTAEQNNSRDSDNGKKQTSQNTVTGNLKSYIDEKLDILRTPESFVARDGSDRRRRTASMRTAASKLRRKEMKIQDKTASLEDKLQEQIQKKQDKLNKTAAKMRGQISKSRVSKKIQKQRGKLAETTAARKEQERQDVKKAWGEVQQKLAVKRAERDQVKNAWAQAKQRLDAKKDAMNKKDPKIAEILKYGTFVRGEKPTR